jgi:hypothetical protein
VLKWNQKVDVTEYISYELKLEILRLTEKSKGHTEIAKSHIIPHSTAPFLLIAELIYQVQ